MNLLARILSHGFAFAVVALLILVLVYRGDLFKEGELPEFLTFKNQPASQEEAGSGTGGITAGEDALPADATAALPERSKDAMAPGPATGTSADMPAADEMPATGAESVAQPDTLPATGSETAAEPADNAEPDNGSDTEPVSEIPSAESSDEPPAVPAEPVHGNESATGSPGDATETTVDVMTVDESITAVEVQPAVTQDASDESTAEPGDEVTGTIVEETIDVTSVVVEAPMVTATEEAVSEESTPAEAEPPEAVNVPAMAPMAAPAYKEMPQTNTGAVAEAPYKVMAKARESFWLRDFETAEQQYRKLTRLEPDNPDGYGELGNMYFSQGKWEEAAAAYYEAGTRLLTEGLVPQAREMLEVIRGLNGPQASDLESQIAAATASSP